MKARMTSTAVLAWAAVACLCWVAVAPVQAISPAELSFSMEELAAAPIGNEINSFTSEFSGTSENESDAASEGITNSDIFAELEATTTAPACNKTKQVPEVNPVVAVIKGNKVRKADFTDAVTIPALVDPQPVNGVRAPGKRTPGLHCEHRGSCKSCLRLASCLWNPKEKSCKATTEVGALSRRDQWLYETTCDPNATPTQRHTDRRDRSSLRQAVEHRRLDKRTFTPITALLEIDSGSDEATFVGTSNDGMALMMDEAPSEAVEAVAVDSSRGEAVATSEPEFEDEGRINPIANKNRFAEMERHQAVPDHIVLRGRQAQSTSVAPVAAKLQQKVAVAVQAAHLSQFEEATFQEAGAELVSELANDALTAVSPHSFAQAFSAVSIPPTQKALEGTFFYLDRDKKLPIPLPAKLACTGNCQSANPSYRATLWGSGGKVVFGNLQLNAGFVGFGTGPAPNLLDPCKTDFTVIVESDQGDVGNIFAAYSPCGKTFKGGASIYTKNAKTFLATLKNDLMNDVRIWQQVKPNVPGTYHWHDRNVHSTTVTLSIQCTANCATPQPTYSGTLGDSRKFVVTAAPDGYVSFGKLDVLQGGKVCGQTAFTLITPPKGLASGAAFLAASKPLPACGYAGQAIRIE